MAEHPNSFEARSTLKVGGSEHTIFRLDALQSKYDVARLHAINARPAAYETQPARVRKIAWQALLPTSQTSGQPWRYTTNQRAADWAKARCPARASIWSDHRLLSGTT